MHLKGLRTTIIVTWLLVGLALAGWSIWSIWSAWQYFHFISGDEKASILLLAFAGLATVGSIFAWRGSRRGELALQVTSVLGLLYTVIYVVFGGLEDAPRYLPGLAVLALLSVSTLATFTKDWRNAT